MIKTLKYGFLALKIAWAANGYFALLSIFSKLYDSTLFPFIQVFLLSKLLDLIATGRHLTFNDLGWMIAAYLIASIVRLYLVNFLQTKDLVFAYNLNTYLELQVDKKLSSLDPAIFERPEFQSLIVQMDDVNHNIDDFIIRFIGLIDAAFKATTATIILLPAFPFFVPLIFIASVPSLFALNNFRGQIYPYIYEKRSQMWRVMHYIKGLLTQDATSKEIAIFKNGDQLINKLEQLKSDYFQNFSKVQDATMYQIFFADLFQFAAFVVTQIFNLTAVLAGKLSIGQFSLYFQQTLALASGTELMLDHYSASKVRVKYMEKYEEFMCYPHAVKLPAKPISIPSSPVPPIIEFRDVAFRYPGTERNILESFNLTIKNGERVALVGENGAGKTTIIKLLLRFYDATSGEILINGVNIKEIDLDSWYKMVGALFQDFVKYQFTFKENVFFGDLTKNENMEFLKEATEKSGADSFLDNLPEGVNQVLGKMFDKGIDLSGGQWQKLALARAFFRDAPILILDEPTSAIDAKAEYEIFERVQKLQKDKTVIIISHRFSTVRNADRVLVLNDGKIIEEGSHKKLLSQKGMYAELFNIQAQGYK